MKKRFIILLVLCLCMSLFTGCGKGIDSGDKIKVVCTTFPIYDWTMSIVGKDNSDIEVTLLLDNGVDMHSFQPGAKEIALVSGADMLIYVGGESDTWVGDALKETPNKSQKVLSLMELLGDKAKEEDEFEIDANDKNDGEVSEEENSSDIEYDEHVWLSLTNAAFCAEKITEEICSLDSKNKDFYEKNCADYIGKLNSLDESFREEIKAAKNDTVVVADRFPYKYLMDDYGIKYYAAFPGCSAETEASFEIVVYLAGKLDETGAKYVVVTESSDKKIAETVISNTKNKNQEIIVLNSIQCETQEDFNNGISYYGIMEENLANLLKVIE